MPAADPRYQKRQWRELRLLVLDRDRWTCQVRGAGCTQAATSVDHIVSPLEAGDFWNPSNLRASCRACNSRRGAVLARARAARYRTGVATYESRW